MVSVIGVVGPAACNSDRGDGWFSRPKSSRDYLDMALESEGADDRRRGVTGLARSADGASDWALRVFDTVARTDRDATVRCAAIQALRRSANADQVPLALKLLQSQDQRADDVRPAPGSVRWEAAKLLATIVREYTYESSQRDEIVGVLLDRLARDPDRNVRLTVIDALACFPQRPVPDALIDALAGHDFAIQHAAERALISLTGTTHHHDAQAWRAWLASTQDPFENYGRTPPELKEQEKPRWRIDWEW